ncbi:hemolysin family protein [Lentibacillus sediminis]|uniref:hemolysin family protein n=1 Tax=Lentibacillus sediminis TaxID=1940529 RepID=UPI000C1B8D2D|nr:CNNM domain-containing protein [Lentibacillus sediminis]
MIIAIILLLFTSFFFSGSETALTATNRMRLQTKANNGDVRAEKLLNLVSKPSEFITSILIGNNIANILLPTLVTTLAIQQGFSVAAASAILTITIIICSEVIPKSVAAAYPDRISSIVYPIIRAVVIILKPLTIALNWMTDRIVSALSRGQDEDVSVSKEEFRAMVDIAGSEGTFEKEESHRIKGVLDFYNLNVKDVLKTPRVDMIALPDTATFEEVRDVVLQNPYTRYPVYRGDSDNIIGIFHSKFLLNWAQDPDKKTLVSLADMEPLVIYEFHSIEWIFRKMTKEKKHMAVVLDEYGGTEGILSHEDIIEAMIGLEIEDEMDLEDEMLIEKLTETEIICDGKIPLYRLNSIFQTRIPEDENVLAGYLLKAFHDFPEEGDTHEEDHLTFEVMEVENRSIKQVRIVKNIEEETE